MPLALRDLQAAFAAHLRVSADLAAGPGRPIPAAAAARVHRHHVSRAWIGPGSTFSTVQARSRRVLPRPGARLHCRRCPLSRAGEYGRSLSGLHRGHDAARDLPYLADVARLDWALNLASTPGGRLAASTWRHSRRPLPSLRLSLVPDCPALLAYPLTGRGGLQTRAPASGRTRGRRRVAFSSYAGPRCGVRKPSAREGLRLRLGEGLTLERRPPGRN